ncbi:unnamed protein product [Closterium sp. NIES-54]
MLPGLGFHLLARPPIAQRSLWASPQSGSGVASESSRGAMASVNPISLAGPSPQDVQRTKELEKFLVDAGLYESQDEAILREEVLGRLDEIVKVWVKSVSRRKGFNDQFVADANAKIFTFGSYRLGVHGPGADIDTLCVGPRHATREVRPPAVAFACPAVLKLPSRYPRLSRLLAPPSRSPRSSPPLVPHSRHPIRATTPRCLPLRPRVLESTYPRVILPDFWF